MFQQNLNHLTSIPNANTTGTHKIKPWVMETCHFPEMLHFHPCFAKEEPIIDAQNDFFPILFCLSPFHPKIILEHRLTRG